MIVHSLIRGSIYYASPYFFYDILIYFGFLIINKMQ